MDASSTHEDAHSSLPPSSPPLLPDTDDEHRVYLAPIGLDTVPCVYSGTTQTVTQLALRPDPRAFASSALCDRFSEVQEHVTDLVATVLHVGESGAVLPDSFTLHSALHGFSLDCSFLTLPSSMVNAPEVNGTAKSSALIEQRKCDPRNRAGIASYTAHWDKSSARDTAEHTEARKDKYTDVVNGYYDGATELYEYGWGESFHFCRYYKGEPFYQAIARHEHYLAHMANLKPGMRVLDVGCGVGGPAREISRFSDCEVVGLNNNEFQVQRARKYTAKAGLSNQVSFVKGDFMALAEQFGENSFDAVYAIEATCHAPTWEGVYGEIFKVLKPGGVFGVYEWCMTDRFDQSNPRHKEVQHGIELGNGIPEMRPIAQARDALTKVGFAIEHEEDLAARDDPVDWWYSLSGDLSKAQTFWDLATVWRMTHWGRNLTGWGVYWLEKVGLVPKGTHDVQEALKVAADSLVAGAKEDLFTPMMLFVARKPESSS